MKKLYLLFVMLILLTGCRETTDNPQKDDDQDKQPIDVVDDSPVIIEDDTEAPVVTLLGDSIITLEVGSSFDDPGATYTDNVDANGDAHIEGVVNTNIIGQYTLTYSMTDEALNVSNIVTRTVNVVDTTAPVLNILGHINYTIGDGIPSIANFVTATDNYDGDIVSSLEFDFDVEDYLSPGTYVLTLSVSDTSGNTTSADITIEVVGAALDELSSTALAMLQGLVTLFTATPEQIELNEIGKMNYEITEIDDLTGNGYLEDKGSTSSIAFNKVTTPEYIEIVNAYNGSLSTMQTYLSVVLPVLANITEYEVEYTYSGYTFTMIKVNDQQYQISVVGTIMDQPINILIAIDQIALTSNYMYSIQFSTSFATWYYEIDRGLLGIESIVEIKELLGDNYGVVYANGYFINDDGISGFVLKDEMMITRRMYFEFNDNSKGIYYLNDDTGTEKYISLDNKGELVFEYENYQPNVPFFGSEKARWALDKFSGIYTIEFDDTLFSKKFIVNASTEVSKSDTFNIEAKNYSAYLYNTETLVFDEVTSGNWMLRIEKDYDTDFNDYFVFESFMTPTYTYNVKEQVLELELNKDSIDLFSKSILTITKEEILGGVRCYVE